MRMNQHLLSCNGQSLVEYALIMALISVICIGVLTSIGQNIDTKLGEVDSALGGSGGGAVGGTATTPTSPGGGGGSLKY